MKETDIPEDFHVRKHGIEKEAFRLLLTNKSKKLQGKAESEMIYLWKTRTSIVNAP